MSFPQKVLLLIGDGMADRPLKELGDKTPLEFANTPNMDKLADLGECGLMDPIGPGVRVGSDTSHLAILGYEPHKNYTGRGPFEALGVGLEVKGGDISFRCNFATVDDNFVVLDRRAGRINQGTDQLAAALNGMEIEDVKCLFKESVEHRAALILRGSGLGAKVNDIDPHAVGVKVRWAEGEDEPSKKTASVVNQFVRQSFRILSRHPVNLKRKEEGKPPANIILPRGIGVAPHLENFKEKYGLTGACIVEVDLIRGLGRYLGMEIIDVPGSTGNLDTDTTAIGKAVVEALKNYEFVLCNIKGPDVGGHDANIEGKIKIIERIDAMLGDILEEVDKDTLVILTADHSTPIDVRDHSGDAVPIAFYGEGVRRDKVKKFSERDVVGGGLLRICGLDLMNIVTNLMNKQEKFGA